MGEETNGPSVQVKTWENPQERTRDSSVVRVMVREGWRVEIYRGVDVLIRI